MRHSIKYFFRLSFFILLLASIAAPLHAGSGNEKTIGQAFAGEELVYEIGFWIFDDVAEGRLKIEEGEGGLYTATLTAQTSGFVGTILRHRRDKYIATLRMADDGKRFVTESFDKEVEIDGKDKKRAVHTVDYVKRTVSWDYWKGGKKEKEGSADIPEGMFVDDPIAAFYNFRFGSYGKIEEGRVYNIASFPRDGRFPEISIRIVPEKELKKKRKRRTSDYLADARIDKDLFGSKNGEIEINFTNGMLPVQAVAKGVLLFGDVKGKLREVNLSRTEPVPNAANPALLSFPRPEYHENKGG
ncbi:MAG: DUF3108 domain-containing protein [Deltaproteobacteria bacterium]|nr:DUF3108 domain-containing protein [Deltaproteobacteria bacterium]MBZ0219688.1 DUF3108 domain-containing protein [Deltaproteobacteria bacterium]